MSIKKEENYLIKCNDVSFFTDEGKLVGGLDLEIKKGENVFILSSEIGLQNQVLYFLAGFATQTGGEILYGRQNFKRDICFIKNDMEYPLSVLDVVVGAERCGLFDFSKKKRITARAEEMLEKTEILHLKKRKFSELSTGEKRRVQIARALFSYADTVFLECPSAGLDAIAAKNINTLIKNSGKTVIRSSVSLYEALEYADKILLCDYDSSFFGTPEEFIAIYG
ncbi:MAG: ATP-binding cassette domain-containing protein [Ruminococcaceae bacterium]|nr:ATP-binding cassette domain-containing protein [Oscillospiraceae bacterium]